MGSSAAATCTSAWMTRAAGDGACFRACLYDGHSHPLSEVEGWHAPAGRRTCETLASDPGQADQTGSAGGCQKNWDPADRSFHKTTRAASAESEVRPGPRLPTLRAHHIKIREAAPEALPTLSLPRRKHYPQSPCRIFTSLRGRPSSPYRAQIGPFGAASPLSATSGVVRHPPRFLPTRSWDAGVPIGDPGAGRVICHGRPGRMSPGLVMAGTGGNPGSPRCWTYEPGFIPGRD